MTTNSDLSLEVTNPLIYVPNIEHKFTKRLNELAKKVEDQNEVVNLVLTQMDMQNDKLKHQEKLIENLMEQMKALQSASQTKDDIWKSQSDNGGISGNSIHPSMTVSEMVKQTAEETMTKSGFVYDASSGLYLDYSTGYYYDSVRGLYYNGHTGTYYTYDAESQEYKFHSQTTVQKSSNKNSKRTQTKIRMKTALTTYKKKKTSDESKKKNVVADAVVSESIVYNNDESTCTASIIKVKSLKNDVEEGELSSSSEESQSLSPSLCQDHSDDDEGNECSDCSSNNEKEKPYPPCVRAIVVESEIETLKKGQLFIVTCTGGSIGREGSQHSILLPDPEVEKHHCDIVFNDKDTKYMISGLASESVTILDGKHLSLPNENEQCEILHGSKLQIGKTLLLFHIHPGSFTCGHCEPGLLLEKQQTTLGSLVTKKDKEKLRKAEIKKIRKKYGIGNVTPHALTELPELYQDRAHQRRLKVGSENPFEKTEVASLDQALNEKNKGFKMMSKMGWKEGASLGASGDSGIKEPITMEMQVDRSGLGATPRDSHKIRTPLVKSRRTSGSKEEMRVKTVKRFNECANQIDDQKPS